MSRKTSKPPTIAVDRIRLHHVVSWVKTSQENYTQLAGMVSMLIRTGGLNSEQIRVLEAELARAEAALESIR